MKKRITCFFIILCFILSIVPVNMLLANAANDAVPSSDLVPSDNVFEFVKDMGLGWNLGNSLDSISGQKTHDVTATETAWGNPVTTRQMIQMVADAGFKTVRVPVTYYDNSDTEANIDEEWLDRVEEVVNYVLDCNMYCIINVHHDTGMGAWINTDTANYAESSYRLQTLWQQIAERFKSYDNRLVFEGFNEILNSQNQWDDAGSESYENTNKLNQLFVDTVRSSGGNNSSRYLITNLYAAIPSSTNIEGFELPNDSIENHIIVGFHSYNTEKSEIDAIFELIKTNFTDKGVPSILGEYGMTNSTNTDNTQTRVTYIYNVISEAKKLGIACFWWDNGGAFSDADKVSNYALLDRYNLEWYFPELVNAMTFALENDVPDDTISSSDATALTTASATTSTTAVTNPTVVSSTDNVGDANNTKVDSLLLSAGRKSISTDITLGLDSEYEITLSVKDANKYGNFMLVSNDKRICYRVRQELSDLYVAYGYNNFGTVKLVANQKYVVSQKGNKTYVDGQLVRTCVTQDFEEGKLTIGDAEMNFYGMTVTENGKVVHDLIPVLDASGKACIKDQITGKFYYAEADIQYVKNNSSSTEQTTTSTMPDTASTTNTTSIAISTAPVITAPTQNTTIYDNNCERVDSLLLSAGKKSISTDITLGLDSEYEITISVKDTNKYGNFMLVSNDNRICYRVRQELGDLYVAYGYNNFGTVKLVANQKYVVSQKGNKTYVDGQLVRTCVRQVFAEGKLTIGDAEMNFYGMTVTENGKVVHDLIPVLDASGKACIKDQITGKFYYAEADIQYVKVNSSSAGQGQTSTTSTTQSTIPGIISGTTKSTASSTVPTIASGTTPSTVSSTVSNTIPGTALSTAPGAVSGNTSSSTRPTQNTTSFGNGSERVESLLLSAGRKSIPTDITLDLDSEYEITISVKDANKYGNFMLVSNDKRICYRVRQELSDLYVAYGYNNFGTVKLVANQKYVVSQKGDKTYVDGQLVRTCVTQDFEEGKLTIGDAEMNFYGMTVTENGKVVHDLIPALDASGKACIKDQITGKFYYAEADIEYVK